MSEKKKYTAVAKFFLTKKEEITKDVTSRKGNETRKGVTYCVYSCPRKEHCTAKGSIEIEKGTGLTNGFMHLKTCIASGSEKLLLEKYEELKTASGTLTQSSIAWKLCTSPKEKAMYEYINIIVSLSLPISYIENPIFRSFSKHSVKFSLKTLRETIYKLVEIVETNISKELEDTRGAVMHDGWSTSGTHYLAILAVYMKKCKRQEDGKTILHTTLKMPLLSISPIAKHDDEGEIVDAQTIIHDTEAHVRQLESIFHIFNVDVHKWAVCQLGDSCPLNKAIAKALEKPHVGCCNHKLSNEVKKMVKDSESTEAIVSGIKSTMRECKKSINNTAMLQRLTDLRPIVPAKTRWSGLCHMLKRFLDIRDELQQVSDTQGLKLSMPQNGAELRKTERLSKQLKEIDFVTQKLQERGAPLERCRLLLDTLLSAVATQKDVFEAPLYLCSLKDHYIKLESTESPDHVFESGVIKIQRGQADDMTDAERAACAHLKSGDSQGGSVTSQEPTDVTTMSMKDLFRSSLKRRRVGSKTEYMNLDFILGSTSEVERLFSVAGNILTTGRRSLTPMMFESLLFLKVNRDYWDESNVAAAMSAVRSEKVARKVRKDSEHISLEG